MVKISPRECGKCYDTDTMLICMECLRLEKEKILKDEKKFLRKQIKLMYKIDGYDVLCNMEERLGELK